MKRARSFAVAAALLASCGGAPAAVPSTPVPVAPAPPGSSEAPPPPSVAGGPCATEGKERCVSASEAVACHDGRWAAMRCGGAEGCRKVGGEDQCHQAAVQENDICNLDSDFTCRSDERALMTCGKHRWTLAQTCLGARKCTAVGTKVSCDNSLASLGDVCREEDDYACAIPDGKSALACRQGRFVLASHCRGPKACVITGDKESGFKVECDDTIAIEGDPCDKDGHYSCAADATRILSCKGKRYVADDKCKGRERCMIRGGMVGCYPK